MRPSASGAERAVRTVAPDSRRIEASSSTVSASSSTATIRRPHSSWSMAPIKSPEDTRLAPLRDLCGRHASLGQTMCHGANDVPRPRHAKGRTALTRDVRAGRERADAGARGAGGLTESIVRGCPPTPAWGVAETRRARACDRRSAGRSESGPRSRIRVLAVRSRPRRCSTPGRSQGHPIPWCRSRSAGTRSPADGGCSP